MSEVARDLYLDLMKKAVANTIYQDPDIWFGDSWDEMRSGVREDRAFDAKRREYGMDVPRTAHTMVGLKRLDNIRECVTGVLEDDVPGDLVETGVWRGGASIFMRAILKAYEVKDRTVWVADSFEGLPVADTEKYPADRWAPLHLMNDLLTASADTVRENFKAYGLLDGQVRFLEGWFRDTLPDAPIERLAVLRMDGDLYESTMDALTHLYPKLSPGGYVIVDDYSALVSCRLAVTHYREKHGIGDPIHTVDRSGVYWQKSG
ncbi:demethyldecarbamoylnovobiocin O-methyltransferase/8-demethyl-8-(2,3-dimethoxy-alpha-L-rhamnosyl)tetracenomycin-C 4'-O-methyltransferase [Sinosporangium album]|uniref:Demethyldecarbamoylnovobiocin O-methyltransferase/8-demethyl-8-(2,3-dimethoxy-alpha-L-rhamnosyl)tetracenomycin-C 4'-O-methyltransferase n=1 Tax=Sinosporangium album TaxID=504805 RepID=A0A1G7ZD51_9ACTN|nr:TylF/MycF family methyltransferase [Sinosporangium album]SDH06466.1 demethyldecarbamoylnovobiocin O-methyltransferase/8-demethyl-8-(2,3-dimethoxy-alpha-L-rhamnosyl)tetracenomycin-C 4'-O-methyltransferase [Sinosporangium album]